MIVRISEGLVRPGMAEAFRAAVLDLVAPLPAQHPGLVAHEVLVAPASGGAPDTLLYVSRWRDEAAVAGFAGPCWRTDPVTFPDEDSYLLEPLRLRHFETVDVPAPRG